MCPYHIHFMAVVILLYSVQYSPIILRSPAPDQNVDSVGLATPPPLLLTCKNRPQYDL